MTDAPRYRLVGYDIGTAPDENGGWVHWTDHEVIVARLTAERDDATRAKDCFQRMTRAHWEALCAMRNSINEYIPMPNTDSGPLFSPEDGPIYADIAERVIADLAESRAYALALEQELRDRARLTAERDAALAGAVKVKPLVWGPYPNPVFAGSDIAFANVEWTVPYCYQVQRDPWAPGYMAFGFPRHGTETWNSKGHPTIEAAKAAAQADYDARILAAIQPDPDARQADLAKAWTMGRDAAAAWHTMQAETAMGALCCGSDNYEIRRAGRVSDMHRGHSEAIRALTPPADLAARIGGAA